MNPSRPPIHQIEDSMRPTWMAGDFGVVAKTIFAGAEALVSFLAIPFSAYMLDVAYGTGNVVSGHRRHRRRHPPNLRARARERATAEDLTATFDEEDAEQVPQRPRLLPQIPWFHATRRLRWTFQPVSGLILLDFAVSWHRDVFFVSAESKQVCTTGRDSGRRPAAPSRAQFLNKEGEPR